MMGTATSSAKKGKLERYQELKEDLEEIEEI